VTIFQQPLSVPRASFSGIFLPTRPSLVSLSTPTAEIYAQEKAETRESAEGGYMCRALEKNSERDSNRGREGGGRYVSTKETSGGSDGKEQRAVWENRRDST